MKLAAATGMILLFLMGGSLLHAQLPQRKAIIAGENDQVLPRLRSIDRLIAWGETPGQAVRTIGLAGLTSGWDCVLGPILSVTLENCSVERWEQALEQYQRLMREEGDCLVPGSRGSAAAGLDAPSRLLRDVVHQRIAHLPSSVRRLYRDRVDVEAQKLFQEGSEQRSARPLRRLVNELFCSSHTGPALDLLGDMAFEDGRFAEALHWWRQLAPLPGEALTGDILLYPDSRMDLAVVGAKQLLALAFQGQHDRARQHLSHWEKEHPKARGQLAGQSGLLAPIAKAWLEKLALSPASLDDESWTTFGGSPGRGRTIPACPPARLWVDGPTWRVRLPVGEVERSVLGDPARRLAFHPVIAGDQVLFADDRSITAHHLHSGRRLFRLDLKSAGLREPAADLKSAEGRFTLSVWENLVFARLGRQAVGSRKEENDTTSSYLVCLDLPKAGEEARLRWHVEAPKINGVASACFEGAPVVHEGRVLTAVSLIKGGRTATALVCYDAAFGKQLWWREVCEGAEFDETFERRVRPHLLTMTAGQVVYCNHAGAVVAVDLWTGEPRWAMRYPGRGAQTPEGRESPRDLSPCLFADGRLYLAPFDSGRMFCVDPDTGHLIWQREGREVVHLFDVARSRLVFTTSRGLQAVDAATGDDVWQQPDEGYLRGLGRGLILGEWIFWPVHDTLPFRALHVLTGESQHFDATSNASEIMEPTMLRNLVPGNMAFAQGCLVVAGLDELAGYVPAKHFLKERQDAFLNHPTSQCMHAVAVASEDAGDEKTARAFWEKLKAASTPDRKGWWNERAKWELSRLSGTNENRRDIKVFPLANNALSGEIAAVPTRVSLTLPLERVDDPKDTKTLPWVRHLGEAPFAVRTGRLFITAGPDEIRGRSVEDGHIRWRFAAPAPRLGWQAQNGEPNFFHEPLEAFTGFQLRGRLLYFLRDHRCLVALDTQTGKPVWRYWAPGAKLLPKDGGLFHPHFHAGPRFTIAQTNFGKLLVLDSQTGEVLRDTAASRDPWPQAPLPVGQDRFAIADEAGQIRLLDAATGKTVWTYEPKGLSSLTGALPQMICQGGVILALVPRNTGPDLVCLETERGTPLWSASFKSDFELGTASCDEVATYLPIGNRLQARALASGKLLWETALAGYGLHWKTQTFDGVLIAHPSGDFRLPWLPFGESGLSWAMSARLARKPPQESSILLVDTKDGQLIQRLVVAGGHWPVNVLVLSDYLIATCKGGTQVFR